jgi:hypothetical protein
MVRRSSTCGTFHHNWHGVHGVQSDSPFWIMSSSCISFITSTRNNKRLRSSLCSFSFFFLSRAPSSDTNLFLDMHGSHIAVALWDNILATCRRRQDTPIDLYYRRSHLLISTHGWLFAAVCSFTFLLLCLFFFLFLQVSTSFFYATAPRRLCAAGECVERYSWEVCCWCAWETANEIKGRKMLDEQEWSNCIGCFSPCRFLFSRLVVVQNSDEHFKEKESVAPS